MSWLAENWMMLVGVLVALLEIALPFLEGTKANGVVHGIYEFLKGLVSKDEE